MPRVLVRRVNPTHEARLQAAKSDWERGGIFKSKRAAARAYDVSHVILSSNSGAYRLSPMF